MADNNRTDAIKYIDRGKEKNNESAAIILGTINGSKTST